jgi:hypothetical protein
LDYNSVTGRFRETVDAANIRNAFILRACQAVKMKAVQGGTIFETEAKTLDKGRD